MEWHVKGVMACGTLSEYHDIEGITEATLVCRDGSIVVARNDDGLWVVDFALQRSPF